MPEGWQIYIKTEEIWEKMLEDIEAAQKSIDLEQYSFWDDRAGHKFLKLLYKKHQQGVKVRILVDGYGSYPLFTSSFVSQMIDSGVQIAKYNPPSIFRPTSWFYHCHKKTLVVDSTIGWLGGIGIKKKFTGFRDTMLRMNGEIVKDIERSFESLWTDTNRKNYFGYSKFERKSEDFKLLINHAGFGPKEIYEEMRAQIQNAKKSIYLTTAYFFPDRNFFQLLLDAAKRGVEIKMILRGKDDEFLPVRFSSSYFLKALKANIQIFRYDSAIIHAKTAIVDNEWATMGSSNLDKFSFYYNIEANLSSRNTEFVSAIREQFLNDLQHCRQIQLKDWYRRSLVERIIEVLVWPIHNYL